MPNLGQLLSKRSSVEHRRIFELCRNVLAELDNVQDVYAVGGTVRDLVMGNDPSDSDFAVIGDSAAFAQELASKLNRKQPSESQFLTFRITDSLIPIDVVTARSERYERPASLPRISPSTIEDDLLRRDFSINAMAISLSARDWGNLVDPSNGFADIMRRRVRVLHDRSFIDDPTRLFRAVRYSVRLNFTIAAQDEVLIADSLEHVDSLSGKRIYNEFKLMLEESNRIDILRRSEELGLLAAISPALRISLKNLELLEKVSSDGSTVPDLSDMLALLTFGLSEKEAEHTANRFDGPSFWTDVIIGNSKLARLAVVLDKPDILGSEVAECLQDIPLSCVRAYISAGSPLPRRARMVDYVSKIRFLKPEITGHDLITAGIPEGPTVGQLIDIVKRARLDGQVHSWKEEIELAKKRLPGFLINPELG